MPLNNFINIYRILKRNFKNLVKPFILKLVLVYEKMSVINEIFKIFIRKFV